MAEQTTNVVADQSPLDLLACSQCGELYQRQELTEQGTCGAECPMDPAALAAVEAAEQAAPAVDATPAAEQLAAATAARVEGEKQLEKLLDKFGATARKQGDLSLELGRLACEYTTGRMLLSERVQRSACTGALVAAWQPYADETVTVQRVTALMRLYQASVAFPAPGKGKRPSLRMWRAMTVLVQRDETQRAECWSVIPGVAAPRTGDKTADVLSAAALWHDALTTPLTGDEVERDVTLLLQRHHAAELTARRLAAEKQLAEATAARKQREAAEQEQARLDNAARLAEQAAAAPADEATKAVLTAAAAKAQQDAAAAAAVKDAARLKQEQADRDAGKADADRREQERLSKLADDKQAKQQAKDDKANGKTPAAPQRATDAGPTGPAPKPPQAPADGGQNLLAAASKGTAKDVASMVAGLVQKCGTPDDCLLESLRLLAHSAELSAKGKAACVAAIAVLTAAKTPAASNGHIAASNGTVVLTPAAPPANGTVAAA